MTRETRAMLTDAAKVALEKAGTFPERSDQRLQYAQLVADIERTLIFSEVNDKLARLLDERGESDAKITQSDETSEERNTCHKCGKVAVCEWTNDPYQSGINGVITEDAWWCPKCLCDARGDI